MSQPLPPGTIDCQTAHEKLLNSEEAEFILLDCRERQEFDTVHVPNSMWLPMSEMADRLTELEVHKEKEIAVICHHGMRSQNVATWLIQQGFANISNVAGGIDRWAIEVDSDMARY